MLLPDDLGALGVVPSQRPHFRTGMAAARRRTTLGSRWSSRRRTAACGIADGSTLSYGEPVDRPVRRGLEARKIGASRAHDLDEVPLERFQPNFDQVRRCGLADVHEPLPIGSVDLDVGVAMSVGAVENAAGGVVHAQAEPSILAAGAETVARLFDRLVGELPVDVGTVRIDDHRGDPITVVPPWDVLGPRPARLLVGSRWRRDTTLVDSKDRVVEC